MNLIGSAIIAFFVFLAYAVLPPQIYFTILGIGVGAAIVNQGQNKSDDKDE